MKNLLKQQFEALLETSTKEDLEVLQSLFHGMTNKYQNGKHTYLSSVLHMSETELTDEHYILKMPITPLVQNNLNILHGGITATLIDTAMGVYANHMIPDHLAAVTSEIKVNYIAPGTGTELTCIATVIHKGKKTMVMEGKAYRDDKKLVAHATASFFIIPRNN